MDCPVGESDPEVDMSLVAHELGTRGLSTFIMAIFGTGAVTIAELVTAIGLLITGRLLPAAR